jgi:CheY-like chemotaxis protein
MSLVLVVDDQLMNCVPLVRLLKLAGFDSTYENDGRNAIAAIESLRPKVVLFDVMMPGLDGFDVLRTIRSQPKYDEVAVIMYTAAPDLADQKRAAQMGAQGYIAKGIPFAEVNTEVRRHLMHS